MRVYVWYLVLLLLLIGSTNEFPSVEAITPEELLRNVTNENIELALKELNLYPDPSDFNDPHQFQQHLYSFVDWIKKIIQHIDCIVHRVHILTKDDKLRAEFAIKAWNEDPEHKNIQLELRRIVNSEKSVRIPGSQYLELFVEILPTHIDGLLQAYVEKIKNHYFLVEAHIDNSTSYKCDTESKDAQCSCGVSGHCRRGTVKVDPWTDKALTFERLLNRDRPLNMVEFLQAHNSFNNRADGYGLFDDLWGEILTCIYPNVDIVIANQEFSITDQLRLGIRSLEWDLHWFNDKIRLCHSHGPNTTVVVNALKFLGWFIHREIDWDLTNIGCGLYDRPFEYAVKEVTEWLKQPENQEEVLIFYFEDYYDFTWGHDDLVNGPLAKYWGDIILTPQDAQNPTMFPTWPPSKNQMLRWGKRILIGSDEQHGGKYIHPIFWLEAGISRFFPQPACTCNFSACSYVFTYETWDRFLGDKLCYPPIMNDCVDNGSWINGKIIHDLTACNIKFIGMDFVDLYLMKNAVWSWDFQQLPSSSECAIIQTNGRWASSPCNIKDFLPGACKSQTTVFSWSLSSSVSDPSQVSCPPGYEFEVPLDGRENYSLKQFLNGRVAWLGLSKNEFITTQ